MQKTDKLSTLQESSSHRDAIYSEN